MPPMLSRIAFIKLCAEWFSISPQGLLRTDLEKKQDSADFRSGGRRLRASVLLEILPTRPIFSELWSNMRFTEQLIGASTLTRTRTLHPVFNCGTQAQSSAKLTVLLWRAIQTFRVQFPLGK